MGSRRLCHQHVGRAGLAGMMIAAVQDEGYAALLEALAQGRAFPSLKPKSTTAAERSG